MKRVIICVTLLISFFTYNCNSQCLVNGDFSNYCGTEVSYGGCPTFNHPCLYNWWRSHGTPEIKTGIDAEGIRFNYAFMWANPSIGEGIFAAYNFWKNHSYTLTVTAKATGPPSGNILVYATSGATEPTTPTCFDPVPYIPSKQLIMQQSISTGGDWYTWTVNNFIPSADYNQLWIFPTNGYTVQFNLCVSLINVCPDCQTTIVYNNGTVPLGNTKSGYIYAGSSTGTGGFGTVNVSMTGTSSLQAANAVYIQDEFRATVSTGSFSVKAITCNDIAVQRPLNQGSTSDWINENVIDNIQPLNSLDNSPDSSGQLKVIEKNTIAFFPIPSNGLLKISGRETELTNAEIIIFDCLGNKVFKLLNEVPRSNLELNLQYLNNGAYYIQIKTLNQLVSKKFIISK
jgi:hypothetical protein